MRNQKYRHRPLYRRLLFMGVPVLAIIVLVIGLELANVTHFFHREKMGLPQTTANSETKGEPSRGSAYNNANQGSQTSSDKKSSSESTFTAPSGNFVSNHRPNLSGSPAPNQMSSTCNTTPGATCQISFSKDGVTKSLPAQTTDKGGSTYWSWKLQDLGLTAGTWKIEAKAMLNNQVRTAIDALTLDIAP